MTFNSLWFVFAVLPAILLLYYILPKTLKNILLVLVSLAFYAWGEPRYLILLALSVLFNYFTGLEIEELLRRGKPKGAKAASVLAVIVNLLLLGWFKYAGFVLTNVNALLGTELAVQPLPLPLGLSFFTFTALSYVLDVTAGRAPAQTNLLSFTLYMSFFPKILSGPIVRYEDMEPQLRERKVFAADAGRGMGLFFVGLLKKVLLADNLGTAFAAVTALPAMSSLTAILGMVFYSLELYFDFSGYSDMAIGLAAMFGFKFAKNFDYPYRSRSIAEFWRRWHISLGAWYREYVYIPLGGNRRGAARQLMNLLIVWLLTGLWHGAAWTFVVWGLWHGAFIILERFVLRDLPERLPGFVRTVVTTVIVFVGWIFFFSPTLPDAFRYIAQIFGADGLGFLDSTAKYYLTENLVLLLAGFVLSGPLIRNVFEKIAERRQLLPTVLAGLLFTAAVIWCVSSMVGATYTTFLYFQF